MRPMREGVMIEFEITAAMLEVAFRKVGMSRFPRPKVLVSVSSAASAVERRAIEEAVASAGGRNVTLVEEPLAAAIGAGLPIHEPRGNLVVDIGGGTSEMAVVSMGGVVSGGATRLGGFDIDAAIIEHVGSTYGVAIGDRAAEGVKIAVGSAFPSPSRSVANRSISRQRDVLELGRVVQRAGRVPGDEVEPLQHRLGRLEDFGLRE